jgi:hypothetical protein
VIHDGCGVVNNPSEILPLFWAIALLLRLLALKKLENGTQKHYPKNSGCGGLILGLIFCF